MARRFGSAPAFKASLETHLRKLASERKIPLSTLQLKFVIERLLARLFRDPEPPWLLKGGFAMDLRFRPHARLLIERGRPEVGDIRSALLATFSARGTHPLPASLDPPPKAWALDFPTMATEAGLSTTDCVKAFSMLEAFWTSNALGSRFTA